MTSMTQPNAATFWDKIARSYAAKPISNPDNYQDTLRRTRVYLSKSDRVLEVGCGTASTALTLAEDVAEIVASDISAEMVAIGQEKVWSGGVQNVTCVQGALGDPPVLDQGPFDTILAFNLLHLLEDPTTGAKQAYALLKPGGYFISKSGTVLDGGWFLWPVIKVMQWIGKAPYVAMLTRRSLQAHITRAGFEIVETHDYRGIPITQFVVARKPL